MIQASACICKYEDMMDSVPGPCVGQTMDVVWSRLVVEAVERRECEINTEHMV